MAPSGICDGEASVSAELEELLLESYHLAGPFHPRYETEPG